MNHLLLLLLFMIAGFSSAQDRVYFLDGKSVEGKVVEIGVAEIILVNTSGSNSSSETSYPLNQILLIEYKSGRFEIYNKPIKNVIYSPHRQGSERVTKMSVEPENRNMTYLNTLSLCNADISAYYERLSVSKKIGVGLMAAYNFNKVAIIPNLFIAILHNPKKNYDVGAFFNIYPGHFKRKTTLSYGLLLKYMDFKFSSVNEQVSGTNSTVIYTPAKGYQLATLVTFGTHTAIAKNFFVRTNVGLGAFALRGEYKEQYNYILNQNLPAGTPESNTSFLVKGHVGFYVGYSF